MSDAKTLFSLSLRDEASKQLKQFEGNYRQTVGRIEDGGDGGDGGNFAQLATNVTSVEGALTMLGATAPQVAAAMAALGAVQAGVEMAYSAAQAQRLEDAYTSLANQAGVAAHTMLADMRAASSGMISDLDLMTAASAAMALKVVDSADEMTALMQVAIAKGAEFGRTPTQAFGELVNGLGRMSPEILNNIGIVIDAQSAYATYAASIGVAVDRLNEQQKMQALVNAVLAANPDAAEKSAAVGRDGAAAFDRWAAATANASQVWGETFLPAVSSGLDLLTGLVDILGKVGDELNKLATTDASAASWTPAMIESQIAKVEAALDAYQDPQQYPQGTAQTQMLVESAQAQLTDLRAVLAEMAPTAGAAAATVGQVGVAGAQAAAGARQAGAASSDLMAKFAALSGQANATLTALRSMWLGAAGALGASQAYSGFQAQQIELNALTQAWNYMGLTGEQIEFEKAAWLDRSNAKLREQVAALSAVGAAASTAGSSVGSMQSSLQSSIESMVGGQLQDALSMDVTWPGMEGPRQDDVNENARRLAAIANEGLIGQDWLGQFAQEAPATYADLMLKIAEGMDAQGAARMLLGEFQAGMRPDLLNFDMIKQQVKDQLTSQAAIQEMTGEITSQLMAEMGVSAEEVQGAMGQLGLGGGALTGKGGEDGGAMDLSASGTQAAGSFSAAFVDGVNVTGFAASLAGKINTDFLKEEAQSALRNSASAIAVFWGKLFTDQVATDVPGQLLSILTDKLLPLMQAAMAAQTSQTEPY